MENTFIFMTSKGCQVTHIITTKQLPCGQNVKIRRIKEYFKLNSARKFYNQNINQRITTSKSAFNTQLSTRPLY